MKIAYWHGACCNIVARRRYKKARRKKTRAGARQAYAVARYKKLHGVARRSDKKPPALTLQRDKQATHAVARHKKVQTRGRCSRAAALRPR